VTREGMSINLGRGGDDRISTQIFIWVRRPRHELSGRTPTAGDDHARQ
jgi:hypothetical protein